MLQSTLFLNITLCWIYFTNHFCTHNFTSEKRKPKLQGSNFDRLYLRCILCLVNNLDWIYSHTTFSQQVFLPFWSQAPLWPCFVTGRGWSKGVRGGEGGDWRWFPQGAVTVWQSPFVNQNHNQPFDILDPSASSLLGVIDFCFGVY